MNPGIFPEEKRLGMPSAELQGWEEVVRIPKPSPTSAHEAHIVVLGWCKTHCSLKG